MDRLCVDEPVEVPGGDFADKPGEDPRGDSTAMMLEARDRLHRRRPRESAKRVVTPSQAIALVLTIAAIVALAAAPY